MFKNTIKWLYTIQCPIYTSWQFFFKCLQYSRICRLLLHASWRQTDRITLIDTFFFHDSMASNESLSTVENASTQAWAPIKQNKQFFCDSFSVNNKSQGYILTPILWIYPLVNNNFKNAHSFYVNSTVYWVYLLHVNMYHLSCSKWENHISVSVYMYILFNNLYLKHKTFNSFNSLENSIASYQQWNKCGAGPSSRLG